MFCVCCWNVIRFESKIYFNLLFMIQMLGVCLIWRLSGIVNYNFRLKSVFFFLRIFSIFTNLEAERKIISAQINTSLMIIKKIIESNNWNHTVKLLVRWCSGLLTSNNHLQINLEFNQLLKKLAQQSKHLPMVKWF